jgi:hypothetical protein
MNFIILVLFKFETKLLAAKHLIIQERTKFDTEEKSSKCLLEIMTLAANNLGSDTECIPKGRSFIYIMNNRGHKINPWETPCFSLPHSEKKIRAVLGDFTSTFCHVIEIGLEPIFRYSWNSIDM